MPTRNRIISIIKKYKKPILLALMNVVFIACMFGWFYFIYHISALKAGRYPEMSYELIQEDLRTFKPVITRNAVIYSILIFLGLLFPSLQWRFWQIKGINLFKMIREKFSNLK